MNYVDTTLWKNAFLEKADEDDSLRVGLKNALLDARKNAAYLLEKIRGDFPNLTIHDITHVDGLWQVASVITGEKYQINPLEGFVLGCAFLIHDAALSYQAVGGQTKLRATIEWKDYYADYSKDIKLTEEEKCYEADFSAIRFLHAKYAETINKVLFERDDNTKFYIIEDEALRNHLGGIIGKIAASHHWSIDEVKKLGSQIPALSRYPQQWRINPIKLACIIRCADAGHIDEGRAPDYLLKLLELNGVSRSHWIAQNRLSQIDIYEADPSKVLIASNIDFSESDFAAWNVACDAVQVLDHEIRISNEALLEIDKNLCFQAKCVIGAESRQTLSQFIKTVGWMPCDANIHISNVEGLIKNLGGEKLYGCDHKIEVVLRELIQNARDAIAARRVVESGFDGKIILSIEQIDGKYWFSITDNGVGMSMQTIRDYLLNFGNSFWASDLAKKEYPGLRSSTFESIGTFGIGFYSVFMVASEVIVETRKYDSSLESNTLLRFPNGLCLRPIVSRQKGSNTSVSSIVRFCLDEEKVKWTQTAKITPGYTGVSDFEVPYKSVISRMTAGLDVDLYYSEHNGKIELIHKNILSEDLDICQWLKDISFAKYHEGSKYVDYIDKNWQRVERVEYKGRFYGLAAVNTLYQPYSSFLGVNVVGGLDTGISHSGNDDYIGVIFSEPKNAKRDPMFEKKVFKDCVLNQYKTMCLHGLTSQDRLHLPYIVGAYGVDTSNELQIRMTNRNVLFSYNLHGLLLESKKNQLKLVFPISSFSTDRVDVYVDYERTIKMLKEDELLFVPEDNGSFLNLIDDDKDCPYNILTCLKKKADELNLTLLSAIINNKVFGRIEGKLSAFVLEVK